MTLDEARPILGLAPDEDPAPHLPEFRAARERIAEMVRSAPNTVLADRYQIGLIEFDQALAAVREAIFPDDATPPPLPAALAAPEPALLEAAPVPASQPLILPFPPPLTAAEAAQLPAGPVPWPEVIPVHALIQDPPLLIPETAPVAAEPEPALLEPASAEIPEPIVAAVEPEPAPAETLPAEIPEPIAAAVETQPVTVEMNPAETPTPIVAAAEPEPAPVETILAETPEPIATEVESQPVPVETTPAETPESITAAVEPEPAPAETLPAETPEPIAATVEPAPVPVESSAVVAPKTPEVVPQLVIHHIESEPIVLPIAAVVERSAAIEPVPVVAARLPEPAVEATGPEFDYLQTAPIIPENTGIEPVPEVEPAPVAAEIPPLVVLPPPVAATPPAPATKPAPKQRRHSRALVASLAILLTGCGAGIGYLLFEQDKRLDRDAEMISLENRARTAIAARQWKEARDLSDKLQALNPTSDATLSIRKELEEALAEANKQAAHPSSSHLEIQSAAVLRLLAIASAVLADSPVEPALPQTDGARAKELLATAKLHDTGKYDAEGYAAIHQAALLAPDDAEIKALCEKLSSYARTLRVPGDFATAAEALADAHDRDKVILAAGEWTGPLVVNTAVQIEGAGADKTIVKCAPLDGPAITFGPSAKGAAATGITFRHSAPDSAAERFSAGLVRGGQVTFTDCHFSDAAGHGLAVIEGGRATASHSRFSSNGWDGASASGTGSILDVSDSEVTNNTEHGLDLWDSATGTFAGDRCEGNGRNGILIDGGSATISITGNQLRNNHQFGLVLDRGTTGKVTGNTLAANQLGGLVIRTAATQLEVTGNHIQSDNSPGLALEKGVAKTAYTGNEILSATAENPAVVEDVDFTNAVPEPPVEAVKPPAPKPAPKKTAPAPAPTKKKKK